jgi:O-antigen/teichoic acid export membrane protein
LKKKAVAWNFIVNILLQVVTAISGFILPPLIISTYGSGVNGMVSSIKQFLAYLNIVEAGVGVASIAALYKPLAARDIDGRNRILSATRIFYNKSGFLFISLIAILALVYPLIVSGQVSKVTAALMVLILGISGTAEFFLIGKYRVLLVADQKNYVISFAQIVGVVLNVLWGFLLIKIGASILLVQAAAALAYLSRYFLILFYIKKDYKKLDLSVKPDNLAINQRWNALVLQISGLVIFNSPVVLITIFCGLKDASIYSVYALIFTALDSLLGSFSNGMQAFFGESLVKESLETTRNIFSKYEIVFFAALGWVYSCAFTLTMPFMQIYTKKMVDANYSQPVLMLLFVTVGVMNNLRVPGYLLINAAGHFRKTQSRAIIEAVINIFASIFFIKRIGFIGVLYGSICSYAYRTIDIIIYSNKYILQQSCKKSLGRILFFALLYASLCVVISKHVLSPTSYLGWILAAFPIGLVLLSPICLAFITLIIRNRKIRLL